MLNEKMDLTGTIIRVMPYMDLLAIGYLITGSYYDANSEEMRAKGRGIPKTIVVGDDTYKHYKNCQMYGFDAEGKKTTIPYLMVVYARESSRDLDADLRVLCKMVTGSDVKE